MKKFTIASFLTLVLLLIVVSLVFAANPTPSTKDPVWTGRWVHTYPGNFWCNLRSFEKEPIRFKNPKYVDDACSRDWPWEGSIDYKVFKEMRLSNGDLKAGNHYYIPVEWHCWCR